MRIDATTWLQALRTQDGLRAFSARAPRYVTGALVLALAAQAALIVTDMAGAPRPGSIGAGVGSALTPGRKGSSLDIGSLVNAHLFGAPPATGASGDGAQAPATNLALVLAGVLAGDDPNHGLAILGESAASAKVYTVGQNVPGGARLHAVYDDRVILDRNGAFESLLLPRGSAGHGKGAPIVAAAAPAANPIDTMRRVISDNPNAVSEILRPTPVFVNGKQQGFRLYPGRNRAAFSHLGLQSGDLVTAVNGTPLDDPARGNEILSTLSSATEAHVTITRNGRSQDLVLNLAQVATEAEQTLGSSSTRPTDPSGNDASGTGANGADANALAAASGQAGGTTSPSPVAPVPIPPAAPGAPGPLPAPTPVAGDPQQ